VDTETLAQNITTRLFPFNSADYKHSFHTSNIYK